MSNKYILIGQTPVPCELLEWARWCETPSNGRVAETYLPWGVRVSTMFMGTDMGMSFLQADLPPILFESMAFWHGQGEEQERCSTWLQAEAMHQAMIREVSRPRAVLNRIRNALRGWWEDARRDWGVSWDELRGRPLSEERVMVLRMIERMREDNDDGW
jgi:hypothetical protein